VYCPYCDCYLAEIKEGTSVLCNKCGRFIDAERGDEREWRKDSKKETT